MHKLFRFLLSSIVRPGVQSDHQSPMAGQSVIEILVATAVVAVVMTGIAVGLTLSVRNTTEAKLRAYASVQAQKVMEVFRRERVLNGWGTFHGALVSGDYCFNTLPANLSAFAGLSGACTAGVSSQGTEFKQDVGITVGLNSVTVEVVVSWIDGSRTPSVTITQDFKEYSDE